MCFSLPSGTDCGGKRRIMMGSQSLQQSPPSLPSGGQSPWLQQLTTMLSGKPTAPNAPPTPDTFTQDFLKNKRPDAADALYSDYLKSLKMPEGPLPSRGQPAGMLSKVAGGVRDAVPVMDSAVGHQNLGDVMSLYPFTPEAQKVLSRSTVVRDSMAPKVVQEEAETNPEKILGVPTSRDKMLIATKLDVSPPMSVMAHELMHSYLDKKGYPISQGAFEKDWNTAKQGTPLLSNIDQFVASSPDYTDEMNETDINQERFAYLAQALGGSGLQAFPKELQRHYAPVFQNMRNP